MTIPAFDTHAFVKKLTAAGVPVQQAEVQANLQNQVLSELITNNLATKDDIARLEFSTKIDIRDLSISTKQDIARLENSTKEEINSVKYDVSKLEMEMKGDFKLLKWMLGFVLAFLVAIVFKLFHA